jgi:hypothetical protein
MGDAVILSFMYLTDGKRNALSANDHLSMGKSVPLPLVA